MLDHLNTLTYESKPDYDMLLNSVFLAAMHSESIEESDLFDWERASINDDSAEKTIIHYD